MSVFDEVYGLAYKAAQAQIALLKQSIRQQQGIGFSSRSALEKWAHANLLDKVVFVESIHQFMCLSHKGEIMPSTTFEKYYGSILYYKEQSGKRTVDTRWHPEGFAYFDTAYIASEQSDGVHRPLYYRDYTVPTGYYNTEKDAFNCAKPFPVFAAETGADTSHIYTYIEHIAGKCALHLLAWLRAKLLYPTVKTQVVPIIISRTQGSGKTTFAEVICKGLFGKENVLVSDQYDSSARFNADYADSLVVCLEEKEESDKRNTASALKSRATATTIRKEKKGFDPVYQDSYTDFIMTSNKDVPIKFENRADQRRFMVMEADPNFTRKTSALADEVFTKLYGFDATYHKVGTPFVDDVALIAQFKHELFSRKDISSVQLRNFPKTDAYNRCFTLPRTGEATEVESIIRSLAPFIAASLAKGKLVFTIDSMEIIDLLKSPGAIQYMPATENSYNYIALCRPLAFYDFSTDKPIPHSVVERGLYDSASWLEEMYSIKLLPDMEPLPGGFIGVAGRHRYAPAARFALLADYEKSVVKTELALYRPSEDVHVTAKRAGKRFRVDSSFKPNDAGCFETVNELKESTTSLKQKTKNVQYLDTFLFESDAPTQLQEQIERERATAWKNEHGDMPINATDLYKERLEVALAESNRLFNKGTIARIVYSGAKSYHLLLRAAVPPANIDEYRWLHSYLCAELSSILIFDTSTCDPARLTRSPLTLPRKTRNYDVDIIGEQALVAEDWTHLYDFEWRGLYDQWCNRPLKKYERDYGKPVYPTRKEYVVALEAIIDGTFWTNNIFDGQRQRLFFPAYRLLRALGYDHGRVWNDVILPRLDSYKKQQEISYWKNREHSAIISQIDSDIDAYNESWRKM